MTNNNTPTSTPTATGILDAIVNGHTPAAAVAAPAPHSFSRGAQITASGVAHIQSGAGTGIASCAYRGIGVDVSSLGNDPQAIMDKADMSWRTIAMPLAIQGLKQPVEYRPYPGMVALVRSDNGKPLSVASESYKPHHNTNIIGQVAKFASETGYTLARVGMFEGGTRGFAIAQSEVSAEAKVGDVVALRLVFRWGHEPGFATRVAAWAEELRCSNGMTIQVSKGARRFTHQMELSAARVAEMIAYVTGAREGFDTHVDTLRMLRAVPSTRALDWLMLANLFQPALAASVTDQIRLRSRVTVPADSTPAGREEAVMGARVVASILESEESQRLVVSMIYNQKERTLGRILDAYQTQPGREMTQGTMAHAMSAVTHYNSNVRGRSADTGLESNMFGTFQADSQRAMAQAVEVAQVVKGAFLRR